ncbi:MoxR family ATPase [Carboxydochorda subterranea]|uniref:MoxR family ATPase n=1 Tax=Carboxydichorda subterranea TaxID=3109565 RepID=A0ABZ1BZ55_9FIRM|nr:MoxR family ATPase [Limnochorda sp. L945t]WRP17368.1 MoxR family ATPase [Limnochorda sp. L945t]
MSGETEPQGVSPLRLDSIEAVLQALQGVGYIADRALATVIFLALRMGRPLFLEGEAGVGKTEVAKAVAALLRRDLVRLQCYEGLDVHSAVYEWNYPRQLLRIRLLEARGTEASDARAAEQQLFSREFLVQRPLLRAIDPPGGRAPVLLVDEVDRADEEFEAFLLEILAEYQVTIPEIGTIRAKEPPFVILTSNRTREVHDALKRRCIYHWIDFPTAEREYRIVTARVPGIDERLAREVCAVVQRLRAMDLYKLPGIAETIDWAAAMVALGRREIDPESLDQTLGCLVKYRDDLEQVRRSGLRELVSEVKAPAAR